MAYSEVKTVSKVIEMEKYFARFSNGLSVVHGFLSPWQKTYGRLSCSLSVSVETDGHELTISLVSVDPILFDDFIYLCHL